MTKVEDEEEVEPSEIDIDPGPDIDDENGQIDEYQLSSSPNDFNVLTRGWDNEGNTPAGGPP